MAGGAVTSSKLQQAMAAILKGADLSQLTAKVVRKQLEEKFGVDLSDRKKEIDERLMKMISKNNGKEQNHDSSDDSDSSDMSDSSPRKQSKISDEMLARELQNSENQLRSRRPRRAQPKPEEKRSKRSKNTQSTKPKKKTGFGRAMSLSPELAELLGHQTMARGEVVKKMWQIIRERNLEDPKNKRFTLCDEQLQRIFGRKRFMTFSMMKYLKKHVKDPDLLSGRELDESDDEDDDSTGSKREEQRENQDTSKGTVEISKTSM